MHSGSSLDSALQRATRVALFGGSFDPPHAGHLAMARAAIQARDLEHVVWVPALRPPHKPGRVLAPAEQRLEMLALLLHDEPRCSIWSLELEREGESYSIDTLRALRTLLVPDCALFLILGSDNLPGFAGWRELPAILELAEPIVLPRRGHALDAEHLGELSAAQRERVLAGAVDMPPVDVSSTELRRALCAGQARPGLMPAALWEYLIERGIYAR